MSRRSIVFCAFAVLAAALFVRLGFWQLARLRAKRERNDVIAAQQVAQPVQFASLPADTAAAHYRRAEVTGTYDFAHELVLAARSRQGSPGIEFLTPLRREGTDTAVLVNRGWVYSPDGASVDRARWREAERATVTGYVEQFGPDAPAGAASTDRLLVRRLNRREIAARIPYPVAPYYLVATGDTASSHPVRREMPVLDDGPHRGYAIQWFSFAVIALVGALAVVRRERRDRRVP